MEAGKAKESAESMGFTTWGKNDGVAAGTRSISLGFLVSLGFLNTVVVGCLMAQVTVPDTPAGHTLQAWLEAFNSGDRAKIETYIKNVDSSQSVDGLISFRNQTGGFDLLGIESSEPLHIRFRVKEKGGSTTALGNIVLKNSQPPTVATFGL